MRRSIIYLPLLAAALLGAAPALGDTSEQKPLPSRSNQCGRTELTQLEPVMATHNPGEYPIYALRHEQQGRVYLRVVLDGTGLAREAAVVSSSGYSDLDYAAVAAVKGKWRWAKPPAECRQTGTIQGVAVDWVMGRAHTQIYLDTSEYPDDAKSRETGGTGEVLVTVGADNKVSYAGVMVSTGSAEMDAAMVRAARIMKISIPNAPNAPYTMSLPIDFVPRNNPENIQTLMGPSLPLPEQ